MNNLFFTRIKKIIVRLLSYLIPDRSLRHYFQWSFFVPRISVPAKAMRNRNAKINVAFCFDGNFARQALVAIASLLAVSKNRCAYNIYCVVSDDVKPEHRKLLNKVVADGGSSLTFLKPNGDFDKSNRNGWPAAIWHRMMLPKLLPKLERIIYADIDVAFNNDLIEANDIPLDDNLIAAVVDESKGNDAGDKINSGFLIMNLAKIRKEKVCDEWVKLSRAKNFVWPDQQVLIETCLDKCRHIPLKFNFQPSACYSWAGKKRFSDKCWRELKNDTVMIHYAGIKPWNSRLVPLGWVWRRYAKQTPFL
jgi:lipopolysaccharide biosynthesis glycosyltransferase